MSALTSDRLEQIRRGIATARSDPTVSGVWVDIAAELLAEVHRRRLPGESKLSPEPFPKVRLPQDPWRQLLPIPVCPLCSTYVHDEESHRESHQ
jgi:hypothetical protein